MTAPVAFLALAAAGLLAGCVTTTYRPYDEPKDPTPVLERRVSFQVADMLYRDPPDCAVIMPVRQAPPPVARAVEESARRHLSGRLPRVIGPRERDRLVRSLAVDLENPGDRRTFARATRCRAYLRTHVTSHADAYLVVWSQRNLGLEMNLNRASDDRTLWKARHQGGRNDGGLPLSPFSVPFAAYRAAMMAGDPDQADSLTDDVVRRMVASLPDLR
ncbi:MAG: hypothetical protein H6907_03225 [Hyphomicrobiales bacterium]|nr:hypothetical protein [Hyphomicrobiales bacterium]MCP5370719.1 hypothetical protein [Hyphomicrobiales bacterium]